MSDDYFDNEEFDSAFLKEVDAIESLAASHMVPAAPRPPALTASRTKSQPPLSKSKSTQQDISLDESFFTSLEIDASELARIDQLERDAYAGRAQPVAGPSKLTRQTTLDGSTLPETQRKSQTTRPPSSKPKYVSTPTPLFGHRPQRTKMWDHTAFSETGWISTKPKSSANDDPRKKGKEKQHTGEGDEDDFDEEMEFEQFPDLPPPERSKPPPPMRLKPELLATKNWLYPLNRPRRDYQFNISKKCLFHNTLVALPTGLGKTFIAGVVMLNYYTWFPQGKIIFLGPTRPLVAQQISACHDVCGIPGDDAVELTGSTVSSKRILSWQSKRVFYMTPQTFRNDVSQGSVDPLDIVLIVFDEAHRATGDHPYAQIVRYMMAKNPHFRILALTATPGNKPETVQRIVDALHIDHIEIRNEESYDLQAYLHKKEVKKHNISMSGEVAKIRDLMCRLMEPILRQMRSIGLLHCDSPIRLHPFSINIAHKEIPKRPDKPMHAHTDLKVLGMFARAMGYLIESSVSSCLTQLYELKAALAGIKSNKYKNMPKDPTFVSLIEECENAQDKQHPKMELLERILISHFGNTEADDGESPGSSSSSKVIIFVQYRQGVDEVLRHLKPHHPMLRPTRFVGQTNDKKGERGMKQKEQLDVIQKFKAGEFNILVSTAVGEEGLDIGEVDRIVCYETPKNSIRMLQRIGRTGRKRAGFVDVLLAEDREEKNWDKSKENYEDVQDSIIKGNQLELYGDVERLLPEKVEPECLQLEMEIRPYVPTAANTKTKNTPAAGTKRKRNTDINRNIPIGAMTGFVSASKLRPKAKKPKKAKSSNNLGVDDDSDDEEICAGPFGTSVKSTKDKNIRSAGAKERRKAGKSRLPTIEDDEDDLAIEAGVVPREKEKGKATLCLDSSDVETSTPLKRKPNLKIVNLTSSPEKQASDVDDQDDPGSRSASSSPVGNCKDDNKWLFGLSDSEDESRPIPKKIRAPFKPVLNSVVTAKDQLKRLDLLGKAHELPTTMVVECKTPSLDKVASDFPEESPVVPEPTFAVRRGAKRKPAVVAPTSSPVATLTNNVPRRIVRKDSPDLMPPPTNIPKAKVKKPKLKMTSNPALFDVEATHSGDDISEGESDVDMVESDSDRRFLVDQPGDTQVSPSYNQTMAYRMGLMTQLPAGESGPQFATKFKRTGAFAGGRTQVPKPIDWSSSPTRPDETDEYEMGSFVVHDDDTILYENSSEA